MADDLQNLPDYPKETTGSKLAARARAIANKLSDEQREALFRDAMQVIYGGAGDKAVCSRP
jgi:hypothetical protein